MNMRAVENTTEKMPEFFKPIFWSYDFGALDLKRNKKIIIVNSINYGTITHWRWLKRYYGEKTLKEVLETVPATELKKRSAKLAGLFFNVQLNHAPRGSH